MYDFQVQLVLLSGKQGSGKDATATELIEILERYTGTFCSRIKFAGVLYEMQDAIYDVAMKYKLFKTRPKKDGKLLQVLGTEWGRATRENIWVDAFKGQANAILDEYKHRKDVNKVVLIATDCRFENEFNSYLEALRVRLECPEEVRKLRAESWREDTNHPSEVSLDKYAAEGRFDLYLDTENVNINGCATLVAAQLIKESWMRKRRG